MDSFKSTRNCRIGPRLQAAGLVFHALEPADFQMFRSKQQHLSSWYNAADGHLLDGVVLTLYKQKVGMLNLVSCINPQKSGERNLYSRIDLVIVAETWQGFGFGHLLLSQAICQVLDSFSKNIYSISCLAAHPTIEKNLLGRKFLGQKREGLKYVHCSLAIDDSNYESLCSSSRKHLETDGLQVIYRLRQRQEHVRLLLDQ